jgi:hypothetical protein
MPGWQVAFVATSQAQADEILQALSVSEEDTDARLREYFSRAVRVVVAGPGFSGQAVKLTAPLGLCVRLAAGRARMWTTWG